jgi:hypothetical protein
VSRAGVAEQALVGEDADLAFLLVDVHANMVHGWPILSAALTACNLLWGSVCHHVERGQPLHPIYALWEPHGPPGPAGFNEEELR